MLERIAQANPVEETIAGSPRSVDINSFPNQINLGWGINNVPLIQRLVDLLNNALFYLSSGEIDFNKMKQQNFIIDQSKYYSNLKYIVLFSKSVYNNILSNMGAKFTVALSADEKQNIIDNLKGDTTFVSISDSGLNSVLPTKIGGNFKSIALQILSNIK